MLSLPRTLSANSGYLDLTAHAQHRARAGAQPHHGSAWLAGLIDKILPRLQPQLNEAVPNLGVAKPRRDGYPSLRHFTQELVRTTGRPLIGAPEDRDRLVGVRDHKRPEIIEENRLAHIN